MNSNTLFLVPRGDQLECDFQVSKAAGHSPLLLCLGCVLTRGIQDRYDPDTLSEAVWHDETVIRRRPRGRLPLGLLDAKAEHVKAENLSILSWRLVLIQGSLVGETV